MTHEHDLLFWLFPPSEYPQWWEAAYACPLCGHNMNQDSELQFCCTDGKWVKSFLSGAYVWIGPNPWAADQEKADIAAFAVLRPWLLHSGAVIIQSEGTTVVRIHDWERLETTYAASLIAACKSQREKADAS